MLKVCITQISMCLEIIYIYELYISENIWYNIKWVGSKAACEVHTLWGACNYG
jgi:hypothetical protein